MDPNATLARIRELIRQINARQDGATNDDGDALDQLADAAELAEAVEALDEWLTRGGFKPRAWDSAPNAPLNPKWPA